MNRIQEINARMTEIRSMMANPDMEMNMDEIEQEVNRLTEERDRLTEQASRVQKRMGTVTIDETSPAAPAQTRNATRDSEEYRSAWGAFMMGNRLTNDQRDALTAVNAELRDGEFVHDTSIAVLVPDSVVDGIWKRAEEAYPLWGDVRKFAVSGTLVSRKHTGITAGDAAWYDEADTVADEQNTFAEFTLTGCELAKSVSVSWKMRAMAVSDFIAFVTREIGDRMGAALGNAVYTGKGTPGASDTFKKQPLGIKKALGRIAGNPRITYTSGAMTEDHLRTAMSHLHSSYIPGAIVYANSTTVWATLAGVRDAEGRSVFVPDAANQGAVGRIFGKPVKVDAAIPDGEVLICDPSMYWANIQQGMTMHTEDHVKARTTDYMGYAIVDGAPYDVEAFAIVVVSSGT